MRVGIDEAVSIYARACRAWYGEKAEKVVRTRTQQLRQRGDAKGAEVWELLLQELRHGDSDQVRH